MPNFGLSGAILASGCPAGSQTGTVVATIERACTDCGECGDALLEVGEDGEFTGRSMSPHGWSAETDVGADGVWEFDAGCLPCLSGWALPHGDPASSVFMFRVDVNVSGCPQRWLVFADCEICPTADVVHRVVDVGIPV